MRLSNYYRDDFNVGPDSRPAPVRTDHPITEAELMEALETHAFYFGAPADHIWLRGPNYPGACISDIPEELLARLRQRAEARDEVTT